MFLFLLASALAQNPVAASIAAGAPRSATLDLWRPWAGADKIYVMAGLPDGSSELFLVDTGASVSVLNEDVAKRLGITAKDGGGTIQGLGGTVPWMRASIPSIELGGIKVNNVDVAVGVPGVPDQAGALPVAGILGDNVWGNFTLVVDYPADVLELYRPKAYRVKRSEHPMLFDGSQPVTPITIRAEKDGQTVERQVMLEIDTGAHDLLMAGGVAEPFRNVTTVGVEPVLGVGADLDTLPEADFLQLTRRIPVTHVAFGDHGYDYKTSARWVGSDTPTNRPGNMSGLIGYNVFKDYRLVMDFPGEHIVLETSNKHPKRHFDAVKAYLERERNLHGEDPARAIIRARLLVADNDIAGARATVEKALETRKEDVELRVMLARIQRYQDQIEAAIATLRDLPPAKLVDEGEWSAFINSLILSNHIPEALQRAEAALNEPNLEDPVKAELLVALSDALLASGRLNQAEAAIDDATSISGGTNGHLLRKARIAYAAKDRYGTIVVMRQLLEIYPLNGIPMWLYGLMLHPADQGTFVADITRALGRLHPGDQPWDFAGAAWALVGEKEKSKAALTAGYQRDCAELEGAERANCDAWYWTLGNERLDEADKRIHEALTAEPTNSAFEDTATMVSLAAGRREDAIAHARRAATLSPDDPYLLWQLSRLEHPNLEMR